MRALTNCATTRALTTTCAALGWRRRRKAETKRGATSMSDLKHYVIRGGIEGRERLRILSRVLRETTAALFERLEIGDGMRCLDVGCGSGDVTMELARRGCPPGQALGGGFCGTKK